MNTDADGTISAASGAPWGELERPGTVRPCLIWLSLKESYEGRRTEMTASLRSKVCVVAVSYLLPLAL